jgi:hypothetical protein
MGYSAGVIGSVATATWLYRGQPARPGFREHDILVIGHGSPLLRAMAKAGRAGNERRRAGPSAVVWPRCLPQGPHPCGLDRDTLILKVGSILVSDMSKMRVILSMAKIWDPI